MKTDNPILAKEQERNLAAILNFASIVAPYMAPILGLILGRHSSFVRFHAIRNLMEQVVASVLVAALIVVSLGTTLYSLSTSGAFANGFDLSKIDIWQLILKSLVVWLALGAWSLWNTINSILDGLQAMRGELPSRPRWTERLAARWSGQVSIQDRKPSVVS
jgi:uncharacterized membrane protein